MAIKIYIDAGHNPKNPNAGAEGNGLREQDITYTVSQLLSSLLRSYGYETRLSRPTASTQLGSSNASSLAARVNGANSWGADYFISIHTNASSDASAVGSEAYVFRRGSDAYYLAEAILRSLRSSTAVPTRGVFPRPSLYVLRRTQMPSVLIELGFITNPGEADLMESKPELFAEGIARGISDYLS